MTWSEVKTAVENADVKDEDEVCLIECVHGEGDKTFHVMRLGRALKLTESSADSVNDYRGCAT